MPSGLLNSATETYTTTSYDRACGGTFENPYNGVPSLCFHMHRVTVRDDNGELVSAKSLPPVVEGFVPGKVYDLHNPETGEVIPGQTFTAEQAYAILFSIMIRRVQDAQQAPA